MDIMDADQVKKNLQNIKIPSSIKLIAVSKKKPASLVEIAYNFGHRDFGENFVQEGIQKIRKLQNLNEIRWHFIGHIQSNKAADVAQYFDFVHTLGRIKIAQKLNNACQKMIKILPVLIEINIGNESQKSGILPENIQNLVDFILTCKNLKWKGFMCIPPFNEEPESYFLRMQEIFIQYKEKYGITELSMGMSMDYQKAIKYGATMLRIGTKIFGIRKN
jgi:hypothetical protein